MLFFTGLLASFTQEMCGEEEMGAAQTIVAQQMVQTLFVQRQQTGHLSTLPFSTAHLRHICDTTMSQKSSIGVSLSILLGLHLVNIGERVEAEQILKQACLIAREVSDVEIQAQALSNLATVQESLGYDEASLASAKLAIKLFKKMEPVDVTGIIETLYRQGWAHYRLGQAQAALQAAHEGYALSQSAHLVPEQARCLSLMGVVNYYLLSQYDIAFAQLEESLITFRQLGNQQAESSILNNMGECVRLQGNYPLAAQFYEEALTIARDIQNRNKEQIFLSNLCGARLRLGQYDQAVADLEALVANTQREWYGLSEAYRFLAEAYLGQGKTSTRSGEGTASAGVGASSESF